LADLFDELEIECNRKPTFASKGRNTAQNLNETRSTSV